MNDFFNYGNTMPNQYRGFMPRQEIPQVNGFKGAEMYQIGANSSVILLDENLPIIYIKQTDSAICPTIQAFDLIPHKDEQQIQQENILERLNAIEERLSVNESITKEQQSNESTDSTSFKPLQNARNESSTDGVSNSTGKRN